MYSPDEVMTGMIRGFARRVCWATRAKVKISPGNLPNTARIKTNVDAAEQGQQVCFYNGLDVSITVGFSEADVFGVEKLVGIPAGSSVGVRVRDDAPIVNSIGFHVEDFGDGGGPVIGVKPPPGDSGTG